MADLRMILAVAALATAAPLGAQSSLTPLPPPSGPANADPAKPRCKPPAPVTTPFGGGSAPYESYTGPRDRPPDPCAPPQGTAGSSAGSQQPDGSSAYGGTSGAWTKGADYSRQRACTSSSAAGGNDPTCLGQNSGIYSSGESPCRPAGGWAENRSGKADASRMAPCTANDASSSHAHGTPQGPALDTRPADTRLPDPQPLPDAPH